MNEKAIIACLRGVQFLADLPDEHVQQLAVGGRMVDYPAQHLLFREGDLADHVYLLVEGMVALEICAPGVGCRRICTLVSGDLLAWSPLLKEPRLTATARTIEPTRVVELDANHVLERCDRDPQLGYEIMRRVAAALSKRLSATRLQLVNVYGEQLPMAVDPSSYDGGQS